MVRRSEKMVWLPLPEGRSLVIKGMGKVRSVQVVGSPPDVQASTDGEWVVWSDDELKDLWWILEGDS